MSKSYIKMQNTFIKINKKLYKIFSLPAELVHMSPQFISSHHIEIVKFVVCRLFERTEMWYEKFNYTQILFLLMPQVYVPPARPVYSSHYILQNVWMSTFNKHTLCYNIETSTICAISAYTFFSFSEGLYISRCDFKTEMLIYIFSNIYNYAHLSLWAHISISHQQS